MSQDPATLLLLSVMAMPLLWVASRIVFSAYFSAKAVYQRRLINHLQRGDLENG